VYPLTPGAGPSGGLQNMQTKIRKRIKTNWFMSCTKGFVASLKKMRFFSKQKLGIFKSKAYFFGNGYCIKSGKCQSSIKSLFFTVYVCIVFGTIPIQTGSVG
jgi:hypothetical protein